MKNPIVLLLVAVICIVKLVLTGLCLAVGFRIGAVVYEWLEKKWKEKKLVVSVEPVAAPAVSEPSVQQAI